MPGDQCFSLTVPNANCTISAGAGAVDGFTMTTDANAFHHAAVNSIIEAGADARVVAGAVFGAVAGDGILIGTPCTIQASAGGGVQIYAGAGISPSLGGPTGPGDAFGPSEPAAFEAGAKADSLNALNDGIKGVSDVVGAGMDMAGASNNFERVKAGYELAKGGWDTAKALGASSGGADNTFKGGDLVMSYAGAVAAGMSGDITGLVTGAADFIGKGASAAAGASPARGGAGLGNTTAATGPSCVDGAAGGALGAPGDGPRIHEVAPANIDRKCGADMTALVAGNKETKVDGKIEYTSGASISMKAFTKVETQSLFFEAHANVTAAMKGLAQAKVESMGKALLDGKASVTVSSMAKAKIEAPKVTIAAKASLDVSSARITIGEGQLTVNSPTTITKVVNMQKLVKVGGNFYLEKNANIKGKVDVKETVKANGEIKGNAAIKNPYFKAG